MVTQPLRSWHLFARGLYCFGRQMALLAIEVPAVYFFMRVLDRPGLLGPDHPWVSGVMPGADQATWTQNIAYRSESALGATPKSDDEIVTKVGRFLSKMVARSVPHSPGLPQGPTRRMPHAVNYLHGAVHHNGLFMLFDDIPDVIAHLTDERFRKELMRLGRRERREISLVLRTRKVDPERYAYCIGCVRGALPWFANGNGPTGKPVLWGNAAPYPVINLIHGPWMGDMWRLWRRGPAHIVREPLDPEKRLLTPRTLRGRRHIVWADRLLAWIMFLDVKSRGFGGQLAFTDRKVIEPKRLLEYREQGGYGRWVACHEVPHPFQPLHLDRGDVHAATTPPTP